MKSGYLITIVIALLIISFTVNNVVEKRQPYEVVIQDIWIIDQNQSDQWLEFLKTTGGRINVDDAHVYIYMDRNKFINKMKNNLCQSFPDSFLSNIGDI